MASHGNFNLPTAVVYSAIIYVLRSLIVSDLPLNQGCLAPIKLIVPPESLVSPTDEVAVCAGNTEASQRVTDVIFKALEVCAASQGGCNKCVGRVVGRTLWGADDSLTFGIGPRNIDGKEIPGFGYYETIA
jgi:5-oxoprolinase (ATP-hydrolysing)